MIESTFNTIAGGVDELVELDEETLRQWESLNSLLSDLAQQSGTGAPGRDFAIPALLGDGDGVSRWMIVLGNVRNLAHVRRLRGDLPRYPWCVAARVIECGPDEIRIGITTTQNITCVQVEDAISAMLDANAQMSVRVQQISPDELTGATWVTMVEAANRLGVKPRTVNRWIERGLVVAKQAQTDRGKEWLIRTGQTFVNELVGV
jgi:hypothetical protein